MNPSNFSRITISHKKSKIRIFQVITLFFWRWRYALRIPRALGRYGLTWDSPPWIHPAIIARPMDPRRPTSLLTLHRVGSLSRLLRAPWDPIVLTTTTPPAAQGPAQRRGRSARLTHPPRWVRRNAGRESPPLWNTIQRAASCFTTLNVDFSHHCLCRH